MAVDEDADGDVLETELSDPLLELLLESIFVEEVEELVSEDSVVPLELDANTELELPVELMFVVVGSRADAGEGEDKIDVSEAGVEEAGDEDATSDEDTVVASEDDEDEAATNFAPQT
jgi:hypothetical protein